MNREECFEAMNEKFDFAQSREKLREEFKCVHNYTTDRKGFIPVHLAEDYSEWLEDKVISIQERLDLQILANDNLYVDNKELIKELKEFGGGWKIDE
jgi:hypothetical protein